MQKIPKYLNKEARTMWKQLVAEYSIDDTAGLGLLTAALEAFTRMRQAQEVLAKDGLTYLSKGEITIHPMVKVEKDSRAHFYQGIKQLNFDLEPLRDAAGRPPKVR